MGEGRLQCFDRPGSGFEDTLTARVPSLCVPEALQELEARLLEQRPKVRSEWGAEPKAGKGDSVPQILVSILSPASRKSWE